MKNTIRNTVEEVYDTNLNNIKVNPSLSASTFVKSVPKEKNSNTRTLETNNNSHLETNDTNYQKKGNGSFIFMLLGMLLFVFLGVLFYFRDKIKSYIDKKFYAPAKKVEITKQKEDKPPKKIETEDEQPKKNETEDKQLKKTETEDKPPLNKKNNNINYSENQSVNQDDMYCYIGEDDDMRQCIQVFKDDICTSGDIYNRIDQCLVPKR